jgi:hypothetical protein
MSRYPISLNVLECPVSKMANCDTRPRPTTKGLGVTEARGKRMLFDLTTSGLVVSTGFTMGAPTVNRDPGT